MLLRMDVGSAGLAFEGQTSYEIRNLVVTAKLAPTFVLEEIAKLAFDGTSPREYGGRWIGLHVGPKKRYVAVYPNGNVLVAGCRSLEETREVLVEIEPTLRRHTSVPVSNAELVVQNIVATADLGRPVNLESVSMELQTMHIEFEPEQFPGLILRLEDPHAVVLLFSSGKFVVTGTNALKSLAKVVQEVQGLFSHAR